MSHNENNLALQFCSLTSATLFREWLKNSDQSSIDAHPQQSHEILRKPLIFERYVRAEFLSMFLVGTRLGEILQRGQQDCIESRIWRHNNEPLM